MIANDDAGSVVTPLVTDLDPLRTWFNAQSAHVRLLALVSSTCPMCIRGRREAVEPLLATPGDVRMAWVFIDMLSSDSAQTARAVAASVRAARLTVFHDPARVAGAGVGRTLGWRQGTAWDVYLVYRPGRQWSSGEMPPPDFWYHQLRDRAIWEQTAECEVGDSAWTQCLDDTSEADPVHFATGRALETAIADAVMACAHAAAGQPGAPSEADRASAQRGLLSRCGAGK